MPPPVNRQPETPAGAAEERAGGATGPMSDVSLARAISDAVRATPGVLELSPGRVALAATYGAGESVTGVVVSHPRPDALAIEVHTVVGGPELHQATRSAPLAPAGRKGEPQGVLADLAEQIRAAIYRVTSVMRPPVAPAVDVFIDDLR